MSDYEKKKQSVDWVAERMQRTSNGKITSEEAHKIVSGIQRDQDRKQADRKPTKKKKG